MLMMQRNLSSKKEKMSKNTQKYTYTMTTDQYEAMKKRIDRLREDIREEIIECLEMNCRGGKQDECHIC